MDRTTVIAASRTSTALIFCVLIPEALASSSSKVMEKYHDNKPGPATEQ